MEFDVSFDYKKVILHQGKLAFLLDYKIKFEDQEIELDYKLVDFYSIENFLLIASSRAIYLYNTDTKIFTDIIQNESNILCVDYIRNSELRILYCDRDFFHDWDVSRNEIKNFKLESRVSKIFKGRTSVLLSYKKFYVYDGVGLTSFNTGKFYFDGSFFNNDFYRICNEFIEKLNKNFEVEERHIANKLSSLKSFQNHLVLISESKGIIETYNNIVDSSIQFNERIISISISDDFIVVGFKNKVILYQPSYTETKSLLIDNISKKEKRRRKENERRRIKRKEEEKLSNEEKEELRRKEEQKRTRLHEQRRLEREKKLELEKEQRRLEHEQRRLEKEERRRMEKEQRRLEKEERRRMEKEQKKLELEENLEKIKNNQLSPGVYLMGISTKSHLERELSMYLLTNFQIPILAEFSLPVTNFKTGLQDYHPYDFMLIYNNQKYIIEIDGNQHFFDQNPAKDSFYMCEALRQGYKIIRLSMSRDFDMIRTALEDETCDVYLIGHVYQKHLEWVMEICRDVEKIGLIDDDKIVVFEQQNYRPTEVELNEFMDIESSDDEEFVDARESFDSDESYSQ